MIAIVASAPALVLSTGLIALGAAGALYVRMLRGLATRTPARPATLRPKDNAAFLSELRAIYLAEVSQQAYEMPMERAA